MDLVTFCLKVIIRLVALHEFWVSLMMKDSYLKNILIPLKRTT